MNAQTATPTTTSNTSNTNTNNINNNNDDDDAKLLTDLDSFDGPLMFRLLQSLHLSCQNILDHGYILERFMQLIEPPAFKQKYQTRIFHEYGLSREQLQLLWEDEIRKIIGESDIRRKLNAIDLHVKLEERDKREHVVIFPSVTSSFKGAPSKNNLEKSIVDDKDHKEVEAENVHLVTQTWKMQAIQQKRIVLQNLTQLHRVMQERNAKVESQNREYRRQLREYDSQLKQSASQFQSVMQKLHEQWPDVKVEQALAKFRPPGNGDDDDEDNGGSGGSGSGGGYGGIEEDEEMM